MFKIGQEVVCVDDTPNPNKKTHPKMKWVKKGKHYIVRDIYKPYKATGNEIAILLEEIVNDIYVLGREIGYNSDRFKPVDMIEESQEWAESILEEIEQEIETEVCIDI